MQPPDPLDRWHSPPFTPTIREGRLYARGVSDDKGPMLIPIKVAEAFFAAAGALPLNVKFMFEGEEEIGSPSLDAFIRDHKELLAADFVISADGAMWRIDEPSLTVSSRGLAGLELTLTAASKDLHSGRHGGAVANPLHAMARLIASLHDVERPRRRRGFLRRRPRAVARRARRDRRAAVRRADVSRAGRRAGRVRRAGVLDARAPVDAADARNQRHVGRVRGARVEDGDSERGARQDHLPPRPRPGSGASRRARVATPRVARAAGHAAVDLGDGSRRAARRTSSPTISRSRLPTGRSAQYMVVSR